jgi:rSAM/selenodomain-associated transferase 1
MNKRIPHSRLIIFTRYPEPGKAKTRLIPALGPDGAADLHRQMTEKTVLWARALADQSPITLEVRFEGGNGRRFQRWLGDDLTFLPQRKGNLGERMARAFQEAFQEGAGFAVLIGTDCPGLSASLGSEAFAALQSHDVVLGPATDGGYYLIGLRKMASQLFAEIPWGTEKVFSRTLDIATELGLRVHRLAPLDDVDRPEDLPVWEKSRRLKI